MRVLFIHQNVPGQFRHIAAHLATQSGYEVLAIGRDSAPGMPGLKLLRYKPHRPPRSEFHPYVRSYKDAVLHGQQVLRLLLDLKGKKYRPDVIVAHPGWGDPPYAKDVFPNARLIHFCEYYYYAHGANVDFDPEFPPTMDGIARVRSRNALHLLNLENCDVGITPTRCQHYLQPGAYQNKIQVIHEGIDADLLGPDPNATLTPPSGQVLKAGEPIITYVARNLEPYRGFHTFMRTLPQILKEHPTCQMLIVGGDGVSYGRKPEDAPNWRIKMLRENSLELSRVHFLVTVPYDTYRKVLQVSAVHVYMTHAFVLSWSLLETMASVCLIIGSDTAPVREVIKYRLNGYLASFFKKRKIVEYFLDSLTAPSECNIFRNITRDISNKYSVRIWLEKYRAVINGVKLTPQRSRALEVYYV